MARDFNIRDRNWDPFYSYHLAHSDIYKDVANSLKLKLSFSVYQVPTWYTNNTNNSNSVINLMFL